MGKKIVAAVLILAGLFFVLAPHEVHLSLGLTAPHPVHIGSGVVLLGIAGWMLMMKPKTKSK